MNHDPSLSGLLAHLRHKEKQYRDKSNNAADMAIKYPEHKATNENCARSSGKVADRWQAWAESLEILMLRDLEI